eukprot:3182910-Amphidinium_carterae.1
MDGRLRRHEYGNLQEHLRWAQVDVREQQLNLPLSDPAALHLSVNLPTWSYRHQCQQLCSWFWISAGPKHYLGLPLASMRATCRLAVERTL